MIGPRNDGWIQPWERQVPAVVDAEAVGVEGFVVNALDLRVNVGLLVVFDPLGKGIFDFAQPGARSKASTAPR